MPQDRNGKELAVGDVVACKFRIANVISDSAQLNLLVQHYGGHEGIPDDWRMSLESGQVILLSEDRPQINNKPPQVDPEAAAPEPETETAKHHYAGKRKERESA
jgi:hypothetical protein